MKVMYGFITTANESFRITDLFIEVTVNQFSTITIIPTSQPKLSLPLTRFEELIKKGTLITGLIHTQGKVIEIKTTEKQVRVKMIGGEDELEVFAIFPLNRFDPTIETKCELTIFFGKLFQFGQGRR